MSMLLMKEDHRRRRGAISALLNAFAFSEHVAGLAKAIPVLIGVMMPVAIFALTKLAVPLYVSVASLSGSRWFAAAQKADHRKASA